MADTISSIPVNAETTMPSHMNTFATSYDFGSLNKTYKAANIIKTVSTGST